MRLFARACLLLLLAAALVGAYLPRIRANRLPPITTHHPHLLVFVVVVVFWVAIFVVVVVGLVALVDWLWERADL